MHGVTSIAPVRQRHKQKRHGPDDLAQWAVWRQLPYHRRHADFQDDGEAGSAAQIGDVEIWKPEILALAAALCGGGRTQDSPRYTSAKAVDRLSK
jgi:hypothetical protein